MINISESQQQILQNVLTKHLPKNTVAYAFGSRVKGTAREYSDLDLVLKSPEAISILDLANLKEALAESDLPFRVDISVWQNLSDRFKTCIESDLVEINTAVKSTA